MAWETRKGRGAYYTRSRKVNGRVVREYGGKGFAGECLELVAQVERRDRDKALYSAWAAQREAQELMNLLDVYCELVEVITRETLQGAGYHRHHRGEWRKHRGKKKAD